MHPSRLLPAFLLATALGCGGKVRDLPDGGEVSSGDDGSSGEQSTGSSGGSGSSGSSSGGGSGGSSSGGGAMSSGETCGGVQCSDSEVCCVSTATGGDAAAAAGAETCTSAAACKGLALVCGSAADCTGGDLCCVTLDLLSAISGGAVSGTSSCKAKCPTGEGDAQLCTMDSECAAGVSCEATGMGGSVCGGIQSLLGGL